MAERFPTCELGEVAELYDSLHQTPQYADEGYPMIRVTDIRRGFVETAGAVRVDEETYLQFSKKHRPQVGDILFSRVGSYGNSAYVNRNEEFCLGQNTVCITPEQSRIQPNFLYCALNSDDLRNQIESLVGGASQGTISLKSIRKLQVPFPPLPVQRRIAGILSAYDELMENSQRRIRLLEAMARALYREWFVHFRFPGHEKLNSSTSGRGKGEGRAKLVTSPLGDIPQGWEVKLVKDILSRRAAGTVYREADVKPEGAIPVLDQSTNELLGFHDNEPDHLASPAMPMAIFGDHTCKMQLLIEPFSVGPNVVPFTAGRELPTAYVFYAVNSLVQTQEYKRHWIPLNANEIVVADHVTAQRFASLIQPMLVAQETLRKSIRNLRRTRDLLLPRLLSGQVNLKEN